MTFEPSAGRLWKRLAREERLQAAEHFWRQPPADLVGTAVAAIVRSRRLRPQVARALPVEEQARALATVPDPGEPLAAGLLVALHLGERRPLLRAFLDSLGMPHEDGILTEDATTEPPAVDAVRPAVAALAAAFPADQVRTYLNALWLQDPDRWKALEGAAGGI